MLWPTVRITVVRRDCFEDLWNEYASAAFLERGCGPCSRFEDGQEFILEDGLDKPDDFCSYAWADIRHELMVVLNGGSRHYMRKPGSALVCCTDAMKPVVFHIERMAHTKEE